MENTILTMDHITKRFPGVLALDDVTLELNHGEVHALVGENGAGKSTLMNLLGGSLQPDAGIITFNGEQVAFQTPLDAYAHGIGFVHQESNLLENLSVLDNVFLAREEYRHGCLNRIGMREKIIAINQRLGYAINPDALVGSLPLAERQCVEITRALIFDPKILILDEPTAALDEGEVTKLFGIIRRLREDGVTIVYISHRLNEIFEVADRITVLKDGKLVSVLNVDQTNKEQIIAMMVGRVLEDIYPHRENMSFGQELLTVSHLTIPKRLKDVSFTVKAGEIVGLGGLEGQGQRDAARAIFGDIPFVSGSITAAGVSLKSGGIKARIRKGVAYVTHDRRGEGLIFTQSIRRNSAIASLYRRSKLGFVLNRKETRDVKENIQKMQIKATTMEQLVGNLSGGNQQKVMLSRWLLTKPKVLMIDEPTKGVDVGARMSVYQIIHELTQQGIGILMLTSDMMELIGLSDRILVFYEGQITDEIPRSDASEDRIMHAASCAKEDESDATTEPEA